MAFFSNLLASKQSVPHAGGPTDIRSDTSAYLVQELRDSHPYLTDRGWHNVATLMLAAADELERLSDRVRELQSQVSTGPRP